MMGAGWLGVLLTDPSPTVGPRLLLRDLPVVTPGLVGATRARSTEVGEVARARARAMLPKVPAIAGSTRHCIAHIGRGAQPSSADREPRKWPSRSGRRCACVQMVVARQLRSNGGALNRMARMMPMVRFEAVGLCYGRVSQGSHARPGPEVLHDLSFALPDG